MMLNNSEASENIFNRHGQAIEAKIHNIKNRKNAVKTISSGLNYMEIILLVLVILTIAIVAMLSYQFSTTRRLKMQQSNRLDFETFMQENRKKYFERLSQGGQELVGKQTGAITNQQTKSKIIDKSKLSTYKQFYQKTKITNLNIQNPPKLQTSNKQSINSQNKLSK